MLISGLLISSPTPASQKENPAVPVKSREFLFTYSATITGLKPGQQARIWLPHAQSNEFQEVMVVSTALPGNVKETREPVFGNEFFYVEAKADANGKIPMQVTYRVKRREVRGEQRTGDKVSDLFLQPNTMIPLDGKPLTLLQGKQLPDDQMQLAKLLYDVVNNHMTYSKKGTGWGRGDAVWACDSRYGNCTDFHSLFISLARAKQIPAKFEMGFPLPDKRGEGEIPGYHCWAWFKPAGHGWMPVDISAANQLRIKDPKMVEYYFGNLTPDRVTFTGGRDINLVPRQAGGPVNFLIYPYVEVDGKAYDQQNIQRRFTYKDIGSP
jgi:hypothetical protein